MAKFVYKLMNFPQAGTKVFYDLVSEEHFLALALAAFLTSGLYFTVDINLTGQNVVQSMFFQNWSSVKMIIYHIVLLKRLN